MNKMLKLASLSGVALGILSTVAVAADLPSRKAPVPYIAPPPVFTWTGFYVGLNAGAAFLNNNNNNNCYYCYGYGYGYGYTDSSYSSYPYYGYGNSNNNNRVGFIGGGQIGYNWQTGPVVFGIEADFQYRSNFGSNNNNNNYSYYGYGYGYNNNNNNGNFLGTVRGRLGYAVTPMFMIYATGGLAYGTVNGGNNNNYGYPYYGYSSSYSSSYSYGYGYGYYGYNNNNNFRVGYSVGAGLEYALTPNWSIKAEYLFTDLGRGDNNNNYNYYSYGYGYGNGNSNRFQFHTARLGVNYRFNFGGAPAPVVARY